MTKGTYKRKDFIGLVPILAECGGRQAWLWRNNQDLHLIGKRKGGTGPGMGF